MDVIHQAQPRKFLYSLFFILLLITQSHNLSKLSCLLSFLWFRSSLIQHAIVRNCSRRAIPTVHTLLRRLPFEGQQHFWIINACSCQIVRLCDSSLSSHVLLDHILISFLMIYCTLLKYFNTETFTLFQIIEVNISVVSN